MIVAIECSCGHFEQQHDEDGEYRPCGMLACLCEDFDPIEDEI